MSAYISYFFTKANYLAVGKNYGQIEASYDVFRAIKSQIPKLERCTTDQMKSWKVLIEAKTMVVHGTPAGDSVLTLCGTE
jgi:hypothetical protein